MPVLELDSPQVRPLTHAFTLSPSQRKAADGLLPGLKRGDCVVLRDMGSDGKTTVLNYVHEELGGTRIGVREFLAALSAREPAAIEEAFPELIDPRLRRRPN
jgi:hypothetical protein